MEHSPALFQALETRAPQPNTDCCNAEPARLPPRPPQAAATCRRRAGLPCPSRRTQGAVPPVVVGVGGPGPEWPCGSPRGGVSPPADPPRAAGRLAPRPETTPLPPAPRATPRSPDRAAPGPRRDPGCARSAYLARQSSALAAARAGRCRGARGTGRGGRCPGRAGRAAAESAPRRRGRAPASSREGALSGAAAVLAF